MCTTNDAKAIVFVVKTIIIVETLIYRNENYDTIKNLYWPWFQYHYKQ